MSHIIEGHVGHEKGAASYVSPWKARLGNGMCTCWILLAIPSTCTGAGYAMKHETWNVFDSAVFLPMARYSPSSVSRRWSYRLNAPMRVGSTSQTLTWSKKYRDKTVGGGAAGATLPRRPSRPAMLPVVAAAAAERPAEAMRPASPRCRPRGDALARREEGQLVGHTAIRRLSGRASAEEGGVRVKPCGKCFMCKQSDASDARGLEPAVLAALATDSAQINAQPLSTTGHAVSERPTRRSPTRAQQTSCIVQGET